MFASKTRPNDYGNFQPKSECFRTAPSYLQVCPKRASQPKLMWVMVILQVRSLSVISLSLRISVVLWSSFRIAKSSANFRDKKLAINLGLQEIIHHDYWTVETSWNDSEIVWTTCRFANMIQLVPSQILNLLKNVGQSLWKKDVLLQNHCFVHGKFFSMTSTAT